MGEMWSWYMEQFSASTFVNAYNNGPDKQKDSKYFSETSEIAKFQSKVTAVPSSLTQVKSSQLIHNRQ